jgi:hypothetical protein
LNREIVDPAVPGEPGDEIAEVLEESIDPPVFIVPLIEKIQRNPQLVESGVPNLSRLCLIQQLAIGYEAQINEIPFPEPTDDLGYVFSQKGFPSRDGDVQRREFFYEGEIVVEPLLLACLPVITEGTPGVALLGDLQVDEEWGAYESPLEDLFKAVKTVFGGEFTGDHGFS